MSSTVALYFPFGVSVLAELLLEDESEPNEPSIFSFFKSSGLGLSGSFRLFPVTGSLGTYKDDPSQCPDPARRDMGYTNFEEAVNVHLAVLIALTQELW